MAEAVSRTIMFSTCNSSIHHDRRMSRFTSKSTISSSLKLRPMALGSTSSSYSEFYGRRVVIGGRQGISIRGYDTQAAASNAQMGIAIGKAQRWWEKGLQQNMKEVEGAQDLVESLLNAGDKLVVVDFYSPGCGGCKALHPKICQLAEMNPDVKFVQVNYEEHKPMCYALNVHVLPFFRFYRGAQGRLCSFSCTNATIKKFKDALAKHSPDRCSLGPTKGLEEKELLALASNKELSFDYKPKPITVPAQEEILTEAAAPSHSNTQLRYPLPLPLPLPLPRPLQSTTASKAEHDAKDKTLVTSGR